MNNPVNILREPMQVTLTQGAPELDQYDDERAKAADHMEALEAQVAEKEKERAALWRKCRNLGASLDVAKAVTDTMRRERDTAQAQVAALWEALNEIARQKKTDELETEYDVEVADFESGYDECINRARAALNGLVKGEGV